MVVRNRPETHFNKAGWVNLKTKFLKQTENLDVAKFREKDPEHLNKIEFLFEDVVATSVGAWAPSQDINDSYNNKDNDEDNDDEEEGLKDELND
ncbi:hypothetical protein HN51_041039 [Arachis hypogaea]